MQQQQNVIGGGMLGSNPYIDQVAQNIGNRMGEAYATGTRAGTFDRFSGDGNSPLGKSAFRQTLGNQDRAFGDALGSTMSNLYMGNYTQERAAQDAAARGSTGLANFGVQNAGLLGQSGADAFTPIVYRITRHRAPPFARSAGRAASGRGRRRRCAAGSGGSRPRPAASTRRSGRAGGAAEAATCPAARPRGRPSVHCVFTSPNSTVSFRDRR
jgi:hypothetical protein